MNRRRFVYEYLLLGRDAPEGEPLHHLQGKRIAIASRTGAYIVDANNFASMKELNPQLGRLKVPARSQPILEGMTAFAGTRHLFRDELIQALLEMHKDPAGGQMAMLFKAGPSVRAGASDFEAGRATWEKSQSLGSGTAGAALAAGVGGGGVR